MNSKTRILKKEILEYNSSAARLDHLRDQYLGKTVVIVAPGPSLNEHKNLLEVLGDRNDIVLFAIKQAYDHLRGQTDFHIVNTYNFDKYLGYDYEHLDTIIFYGISKSFEKEQLTKLTIKPHPCHIWVPVFNPPYVTYEQCMHKSGDYDKLLLLQEKPETWWGTSIMYEQALPLAFLLGVNKIITIGWDLTTGEHSYRDKDVNFKPNKRETQYTQDAIDSTPLLYEWFEKHNKELLICSNRNLADDRFKRIELKDI